MTDTAGNPEARRAADGIGADLPAKAADAVDLLVDSVFDRVIRPLMIVARAVVFGLLAGSLVLMILVLASVGLVRLLDVYAFGGRVWISYAVIGGLFTLLGGFAWSRRRPAATSAR